MCYISTMDAALGLAADGNALGAIIRCADSPTPRLRALATGSPSRRYEDLCVHREAVVARLLEKVGWDGGSGVEGMASVFDVDAHTGGGQTVSARRKAGSKTPLFVAAGDAKPLADLLARHSALARAEYLLPGSEEFDS